MLNTKPNRWMIVRMEHNPWRHYRIILNIWNSIYPYSLIFTDCHCFLSFLAQELLQCEISHIQGNNETSGVRENDSYHQLTIFVIHIYLIQMKLNQNRNFYKNHTYLFSFQMTIIIELKLLYKSFKAFIWRSIKSATINFIQQLFHPSINRKLSQIICPK